MSSSKGVTLEVLIGSNTPKQWSEQEVAQLKDAAIKHDQTRTPQQKLKNELLALQYELEEYLADLDSNKIVTIENAVDKFLQALNISFRKFAFSIDTTDGNLKKYVSGERTFNKDLALRFGHFFHTPPELWLKIQQKNEITALRKTKSKPYLKYDYKKVLQN